MSRAPTSVQEYLDRYALNQIVTGYGLDTTTHVPCPFCAAPEFMAMKVLETEPVLAAGATCRECGRSAKAIFQRDASSVQFEIVQTGGDDPPDWLTPKMRRVG
jgi:hypothetical protein